MIALTTLTLTVLGRLAGENDSSHYAYCDSVSDAWREKMIALTTLTLIVLATPGGRK